MDKNRDLKNRTSHPVYRMAEELKDFNPIELMGFYNKWEHLFKEKIPYGDVGNFLKICLIVTQEKGSTQWNFFDENRLLAKLRNDDFREANVIIVCSDGDVIRVEDEYIGGPVDAAKLSQGKEGFPVIFIDCREIHFFVNAKLVHFARDIIDEKRMGILTEKCLPAREYRKLIENQYEEEVNGERGFKYWKNKGKRHLFNSPEIIFHKPLWSYLNNYVLDGKVDSEVPLSGTSDRSDIRILTFEGRELYIIEIKCLGRSNESKSEESDDWANQGILQLKEYLEEEKDSTQGVLVLYDGREENKKIDWISKEEWHEKTDQSPLRFYLISEGASIRAKKGLKELEKKSK